MPITTGTFGMVACVEGGRLARAKADQLAALAEARYRSQRAALAATRYEALRKTTVEEPEPPKRKPLVYKSAL